METFPMSKKETSQISIFEKLMEQTIKQKEAAKLLRLSTRQVKRKLKAYRQQGAVSLVHKNRGRKSNRAVDENLAREAISIIKNQYVDFGPTFAAEQLLARHHISINHETLRKLMIREGIWKTKKKKGKVHLYRERKECFGEMVQIDGSFHKWFEDRAPQCTLLAYIDDATSEVVWLEFAESESTASLMKSTRSYLELHGRPLTFYADRGGVYKVNNNNPDNDKFTQYERSLKELDIELIHARSPQAKGRVERLFKTLQDRLVKEMRLNKISTKEEANRYIRETYLKAHNAKYAVQAKGSTNLHRSLAGYQLDRIMCLKEERKLCNDFTIRYKNNWYQLLPKQPTILSPKDSIVVNEHLNGSISLTIRKCVLNFEHLAAKPEKVIMKKTAITRKTYIPPWDHPWRRPNLGDISIVHQR